MKKVLYLIAFIAVLSSCSEKKQHTIFDFTTKFEKTNGLETATYKEVISFYNNLASSYPQINVQEIGETDSGEPLHIVTFSASEEFDFNKLSDKNIILINNGIHPGESDGIDASMQLLRNIVEDSEKIETLENIVLAVIPVYNIGGALNRNNHSRANQNGPKEYGFRGNARNFDLNRDFIKADTKNARTFAKIFHLVKPDVFIDNHVSNGADYQYAITHLFTQHNKLGNDLGNFIEAKMRPEIEDSLLEKNIIITPYVNVWGSSPKKGFSQFFDSPRYSTGYTTLFNTLGLMVETHMLKPYKQRVEQTYALMESMIECTKQNSEEIKSLRKNAVAKILEKETYPVSYKLNKDKYATYVFKGYEDSYINSKVTNGKRLFYDKNEPYETEINYFNQFTAAKSIKIPKAYILKQGWWKVVDRLNENNIQYSVLKKDTSIVVNEQHIKDYKTYTRPYEGHYLHYNTEVKSASKSVTFKKGDLFIPINQFGARYLMETLEPAATDSFFNWNFFDSILQRKEGYSAYVFEDIAEELLNTNPSLKAAFDEKMKSDQAFKENPRAQLDFVYKNSPYYEAAHLKLPIYKVF